MTTNNTRSITRWVDRAKGNTHVAPCSMHVATRNNLQHPTRNTRLSWTPTPCNILKRAARTATACSLHPLQPATMPAAHSAARANAPPHSPTCRRTAAASPAAARGRRTARRRRRRHAARTTGPASCSARAAGAAEGRRRDPQNQRACESAIDNRCSGTRRASRAARV